MSVARETPCVAWIKHSRRSSADVPQLDAHRFFIWNPRTALTAISTYVQDHRNDCNEMGFPNSVYRSRIEPGTASSPVIELQAHAMTVELFPRWVFAALALAVAAGASREVA
jgi:hypothetical protein